MTKPKKTREAKPGELRAINILETLEKFFNRPESRLDAQKMLTNLSPDGQKYAKHLVTSGPMSIKEAAEECGLTEEKLEACLLELEKGIAVIRGRPLN